MKKIITLLLVVIFCAACFCGCNKKDDQQAGDNAAEKTEVTFSGDDLALFTVLEDGQMLRGLNLYMRENEIDLTNEQTAALINGCTYTFKEASGEKYINYIYLKGVYPPAATAKSIFTTGVDLLDEGLCSDEEQVIEAYGIDLDSEEVYFKPSEGSPSKYLAVYYNVSTDGAVERIVYPKGSNISDFNSLQDSNACVYFEIRNKKVIGITMKCK